MNGIFPYEGRHIGRYNVYWAGGFHVGRVRGYYSSSPDRSFAWVWDIGPIRVAKKRS